MSSCSYLLRVAVSALFFGALLGGGPGATAGERDLYARTVTLLGDRYLDADQIDATAAFIEAAESAQRAVPWLIVEPSGASVTLREGSGRVFAVLTLDEEGADALVALPGALDRLEDAIRLGGAIPDEVDLPIELLRGVTRALDRHSVVLARSRLERFNERIKGKLSGIGARITLEGGKLRIRGVFVGGPVDLGGLGEGDIIEKVDGVSTLGMSVNQAVDRIRGPKGTQVVLGIRRPGGGDQGQLDVILTRDEVVIPNVSWEKRSSGVGFIEVEHFSEQTAALLEQALAAFRAEGPELRGVVLDLRGNTGGSMIQACRSVDLFVDDGVVLRTAGPKGRRVENLMPEYAARPGDGEPDLPVVILVDRRSASASEILAGALQLLDRAVLVGAETHGKGTVQKLYTIRGGGPDKRARLKLTVARYLLPGDLPIEAGEGLKPDVRVRTARFDEDGVRMPLDPGVEPLSVMWVREQPGWRPVGPPDGGRSGDFLEELAERIVLDAQSGHRADVLEAALGAVAEAADAEDALLVETFRHRGIDWRSADGPGAAPEVRVTLQPTAPARAGAPVEVQMTVENLGAEPLRRVRVHLSAEDRSLPWHGMVLPVGALEPGETGRATTVTQVSPKLPSSDDLVSITVVADGRPKATQDALPLQVEGRPAPPLSVAVRLVPEGETHHRAEVRIENLGQENLVDVRARFALPEDTQVELLERESVAPYLRPGEQTRLDIPVRLLEGAGDRVELELRVATAVHGRVLRLPLEVPVSGDGVSREPPQIRATLPLVAPVGSLDVRVDAVDDRQLASLTAWLDGEKVAWRAGDGRKLRLSFPVELEPGRHTVVVRAEDDDGATTQRTWKVRVPSPPDDAGP